MMAAPAQGVEKRTPALDEKGLEAVGAGRGGELEPFLPTFRSGFLVRNQLPNFKAATLP